jgi:hypothetical protein
MVKRRTPEERPARRLVIVAAHDTHFGGDSLALRPGEHAPAAYRSKCDRTARAIDVDDVRAFSQPADGVCQRGHDATARSLATLVIELTGMDDCDVQITAYAARAGRLRTEEPSDPNDVERLERHRNLPRQVLGTHPNRG